MTFNHLTLGQMASYLIFAGKMKPFRHSTLVTLSMTITKASVTSESFARCNFPLCCVSILNVVMLSVGADRRYAQRHYAECRGYSFRRSLWGNYEARLERLVRSKTL